MTSTDPDLRAQYEDYPYPTREPAHERQRLLAPVTDCLDLLNHHGFGGRRQFQRDFRVLVAGGGTGDSLVFLAEQLRGSQAEIHYLDLSASSLAVAQARTAVRGLDRVHWHRGSLLELGPDRWGRFDYINCSGVLHHLPDPAAGLAALRGVLAKHGVLALMLYGQHARAGVYQMQALMRYLNADLDHNAARIARCKAVLTQLPASNWFQRGRELFHDVAMGDAGILDLLLHGQDRAYRVPELYRLLADAGLQLNTLMQPRLYEPDFYLHDPALLEGNRESNLVTNIN